MNIVCNSSLTSQEVGWAATQAEGIICEAVLNFIRGALKPTGQIVVEASWETIDQLQEKAWKDGRREYEWFIKCYEFREVDPPHRHDFKNGQWLECAPDTQEHRDASHEDAAIYDPKNPDDRSVVRFRRACYFSF